VCLVVALFFASCEREEIEVPRGYEGLAARNHYLAAERLLDRMGMPAQSFDDVGVLSSLPSPSSTLIVPTSRRSLDAQTSERLLEWVSDGGHLIVVSWQLWDDPHRTPDPILDPVGVHQFLNDSDEGSDSPGQVSDPPPPGDSGDGGDDADEPPLADAEFPDRDEPLELRFDQRFRLELDEAASPELILEAGDDAGSHLVTLRHGKGLLTALSDDYFLTQPQIGDLDHAELLYRLTRLGGHRGVVWIVYGDRFPSVWELVLRHGWMVALSAAALLALWLWSASRRFGPIAADPAPERRELMEHVRAAGRLEWRRGAAAALVAAVRSALLARVRERHPNFQSQTPSEQVTRLAALSGLPQERIADALAFGQDREPGRFTQKIALLEKLRRSL
jgi:uncharacterized protein DUF4350